MRRPLALLLPLVAAASLARADLPFEVPGRVETIALPPAPHWVWVGDPLLRRTALVDAGTGRLLGMVSSGFGMPAALFARSRPEIYVPETHYTRGSRGERADVLTIYDAATLAPTGEVVLPAKRAIAATTDGLAALSDDDRFAAIFNLTPATSVSVVDLEARVLSDEIPTPGCSLVYPAGARRFAMLCADGALLLLHLDESGRRAGLARSEPFFDPSEDPVTEKGVRIGERWYFVSFAGRVHEVDLSGESPRFAEPWPLFDDDARSEGWQVGGAQHLAVHEADGRLYALVHRGGPDEHKHPGTEVWVYAAEERRRMRRIELQSPGLTFLGVPIEADGMAGSILDWLLNRVFRSVPELGIDSIAVTQDDDPLLVTVGAFSGGIGTYDARSGEFRGRVFGGNMTNAILQAPSGWGRP